MPIARLIILLHLLLTALYSQQDVEQFPFIGITTDTHTIDFKSITKTTRENSFGIRYGKQTLDWRTVFTLSGNNDLQTFSIEVDKILLDKLFGMPEIRPYLGATVGYLSYDNDYTSDSNGYYYGGDFGFLLYATERVDVDLSYHYYSVSGLDPLESMQGASLSLHYFF
jgi:hypothetical protein